MKLKDTRIFKIALALGISAALMAGMGACGSQTTASAETADNGTAQEQTADQETVTNEANVTSTGAIDASDIFTDRDMEQTADLTDAVHYTASDGQDINITEAGVYVISGTAKNVTITVEAADEDKVQIVLDKADITNETDPVIYVKSADKVFVTTKDTENTLAVTGEFTADGDTNTDAVIFSKDDVVLNGTGTLNIESSANGVTSKDDLKITGGTLNITSQEDALEANDSIAVADGNITISSQKDAMHAENDEDNTVGYIYICGGTFKITASDDGIQGTTIVQIDGGDFDITSAEGIEATQVEINGGTINIEATDDGINGSEKSTAVSVSVAINGGEINISMGQGDTDAVDVNGDLSITGGTLNITAQSPFDVDGNVNFTGGTVIENGQEVSQITNQMMGGGMMGNFNGGQMGGMPGSNQNGQQQMPGHNSQGGPGGQTPQGGPGGQAPSGNSGSQPDFSGQPSQQG